MSDAAIMRPEMAELVVMVIVTINPLAPASIFWNNRLLRSGRAVNRLDRKLT